MSVGRFAGIPRGQPLPGSREIARHIWHDPKRRRSVYRLDRSEFGLTIVCGELLGFTGWIDFALANAERSKRRYQHTEKSVA